MTSESVWFEQVDIALINYIKGIVQLPVNGVPTPVPVKIRKPDEDFKIEVYPCITLYNLYSVRNEDRYYPGKVTVEIDRDRNTIIEEQGAIPYSLYYQFDFWSVQQSQMNEMTRLWLGHHPDRCFNLSVKDMSGKDRSSFVLMTGDLVKSDFLTDTKRTFHSSLTYRVWVELDEKIRNENFVISDLAYPETKKL